MESIFLLILVFLAILAAVDLFVGVSNDAGSVRKVSHILKMEVAPQIG